MKSKIRQLNYEQLKSMVDSSNTWGDMFNQLNMRLAGGNIKTLRQVLQDNNLYEVFIKRSSEHRNNDLSNRRIKLRIPLNEILVENSNYKGTQKLKDRLIKEGLKQDKCECCGQEPVWNGNKLVLQLDHINGNHKDNRIENLRVICPNCHTQTETFCGKHNKVKKYYCKECGNSFGGFGSSGICRHCVALKQPRKVERPSIEQLTREIMESSYVAVGKKYGVSNNAIKKWIKNVSLSSNGQDTAPSRR